MGIQVPDLIIESVIRDGLENIKNDLTIIDDIFSELTSNYALRKYGAAEIQKIKDFFTNKGKSIAVVHSFHEAAAKAPAYSIQLGLDDEHVPESIMDDFSEDKRVPLDAAELAALVKADNIIPQSYDANTGRIDLSDSVDLSDVYKNFLFVDGSDVEHTILAIQDVDGDKAIFVAEGSDVDTTDFGLIRSFLKEKQFEQRQVTDKVRVMIGVHTKEALLTKYLYAVLKYILHSRKISLIERCFDKPVIQGSDFTRDVRYQADMVYTRFLTITGTVEDSWTSDKVDLIDSAEVDGEAIDC